MAVHIEQSSRSPFYQPRSPHARRIAVLYKTMFLAYCVRYHIQLVPSEEMTLVGVMGALAFVLIELSFTTLIDEDVKTGRIGINWGLKNGIGYSSFAMFWVNVCFNPIMLFGYRVSAERTHVLFGSGTDSPHPCPPSPTHTVFHEHFHWTGRKHFLHRSCALLSFQYMAARDHHRILNHVRVREERCLGVRGR